MKLFFQPNEKPKFGANLIFAIQQLLAIMAATLVVPVIIGHDMSPAAALFGAGVGTLVYLLFTKFRSPVFLGSSFAFLGSMAAAFAGGVSMSLGYLGLILGAAFAGLVYVVLAIIVKLVGVGWINKLMPAVVIGPTVAIIGLSLAGNAIGDLNKVNYAIPEDPAQYIAAALSPADVISVTPFEDGKSCRVIVPDDQLSLAIGKEGQNARLAAKLTGWKIDIKPASAPEDETVAEASTEE